MLVLVQVTSTSSVRTFQSHNLPEEESFSSSPLFAGSAPQKAIERYLSSPDVVHILRPDHSTSSAARLSLPRVPLSTLLYDEKGY